MAQRVKEFNARFLLTAGECNPEAVMPLSLLASRVIETASLHANSLDVGFDRLSREGLTWVLSRLTMEMYRWPGVNEEYSLTTWVEDVNRHFSERNFEIKSGDEVLGYARSVWMGIDVRRRQGGDLSLLESMRDVISDKRCPIEKFPRIAISKDIPVQSGAYKFRYCDCDFNRHVNTVRYIELLLDQWDLDFFDNHEIERFDIAFLKEARFGEEVEIKLQSPEENNYISEISRGADALTKARVIFRDKKFIQQQY